MKKTLFAVLGLLVIGSVFSVKANAQAATSDLWCEEAPAGTPVCNVDTNWANRRKQLGVDEVCCVYKENSRGGKGAKAGAKSRKGGAKVSATKGAKSSPKAESKTTKPAPKTTDKTKTK